MNAFESFEKAHSSQLEKNKKTREAQRKKEVKSKLLGKVPPSERRSVPAQKIAAIAAKDIVANQREKTQQKWDARKELREAKEGAVIDELTGIYNRHGYEQFLSKKQAAIQKENKAFEKGDITTEKREKTFSMIAVDLDKIKEINDTYGHKAGDMILQAVARTIEGSLRGTHDIVARIGGDEFIVIVEDTTADVAPKIAERIRKAIEDIDIEYGNRKLSVTASIGVAPYDVKSEKMYDLADKALYIAKEEEKKIRDEGLVVAGEVPKNDWRRNQVRYFDPTTEKFVKYDAERE